MNKQYQPTPEQVATLLEAGFTIKSYADSQGAHPIAIQEVTPKLHPKARDSALIPSLAIVWDDGMFTIRRAPQVRGDFYSRKVYRDADQEQAFNRAMTYVLLGMYDDEVN